MDENKNISSTEKRSEYKGQRLRDLELGNLIFEANGKKYFIESHISPARYKQMELLSVHLGFNQTYVEVFGGIDEALVHLNKTNFVDASICLHNIRHGLSDLENNHSAIMRYCAMFINREDEDRRVVDDIMINEKIEDWIEEGISMKSFFVSALNMVNGLKENYTKYTQDILKK